MSILDRMQKYFEEHRRPQKIEFDFNKIDLISPAFADELARKTKEKNQFADMHG